MTILTTDRYFTADGRHPNFLNELELCENKAELVKNAMVTLSKASEICSRAVINNPVITSGWRTVAYNKAIHGSTDSKHLHCLAIDIWDPYKKLGQWCMANQDALREMGCSIESLVVTHKSDDPLKRWVHISVGFPPSGDVVYNP